MSDTEPTPIDPDTGLPIEEQTPAGGGSESVSPPRDPASEDPTPPDAPVGDAAGDSLLSPDLAGDSLIEGGDELGGASTVLENDELDGDVER